MQVVTGQLARAVQDQLEGGLVLFKLTMHCFFHGGACLNGTISAHGSVADLTDAGPPLNLAPLTSTACVP